MCKMSRIAISFAVFLLSGCANAVPIKDSNEEGQKSAEKCLEYSKISSDDCSKNRKGNYRELEDGEFPHMALVGVYKKNSNEKQYICAASLISERFLLTAAHCVSNPSIGPPKFVVFGIKNPKEPVPANAKEFLVEEVFEHPSYDSTKNTYDLALLRLAKDVTFSDKIKPVCLNSKKDFGATKELVTTGWGLPSSSSPKTLRLLTYNITSLDDCNKFYGKRIPHSIDDDSMLCASPSIEVCVADSGAPLQFRNDEYGCMDTVVGVTNFGVRCGQMLSPDVFSRVSNSLKWIENTVWPDLEARIA